MVDKTQILFLCYRDKKSERFISKKLKISRATVHQYIAEHEKEIKSKYAENHLEQGLSFKPKYNSSNRPKQVLINEVIEEINYCLKKNKEKINSGLRKQTMNNTDIHNYLVKKEYSVSYSTVCNYIREQKKQGKESFIKQIYNAGDVCEFDWGEVKLYINDKLQTFNMAVFTSAYSNYRYAKLFYRQDNLAVSS